MSGKRNGKDRENQMKGNGKYWKQKKERMGNKEKKEKGQEKEIVK